MPTVSAASRVIADGARAEAPSRPEEEELEEDDENEQVSAIGPWSSSVVEEPADDGQVGRGPRGLPGG